MRNGHNKPERHAPITSKLFFTLTLLALAIAVHTDIKAYAIKASLIPMVLNAEWMVLFVMLNSAMVHANPSASIRSAFRPLAYNERGRPASCAILRSRFTVSRPGGPVMIEEAWIALGAIAALLITWAALWFWLINWLS